MKPILQFLSLQLRDFWVRGVWADIKLVAKDAPRLIGVIISPLLALAIIVSIAIRSFNPVWRAKIASMMAKRDESL